MLQSRNYVFYTRSCLICLILINVMTSYYSEFWWGYLTYIAIEKCVAISKERCPGCAKGFNTPILHKRHQASLLDKIVSHLNEARGLMASKFDEMFEDFQKRMDWSCSEDEKKVLIKTSRSFLFIITPPGLFYGNYLTEERYLHLYGPPQSAYASKSPTYRPKSPVYAPKKPTLPPPPPPTQKRKRVVRPPPPPQQTSNYPELQPPLKKRKKPKPIQAQPDPSQWELNNLKMMYDSDIS